MTIEIFMDARTSKLVTGNEHYTRAYELHEQEILAVNSPRLVNVDDIHAERLVAAVTRGTAKLRPALLGLGGTYESTRSMRFPRWSPPSSAPGRAAYS